MILLLETIDNMGEIRDFALLNSDLAQALDGASRIGSVSARIISVYIIDNGKWTQLPVEILDGTNFSDSIKKLENDWEHILRQAPYNI